MSSNSDDWATPQYLFDNINEYFNFTLDPCASDLNHKCKKYYTIKENGLIKSWKNEVVFCNPPYGREISKWVKKAYDEYYNGASIVMLLPARTDTKWFHEFIYNKFTIFKR